MGYLEYSVNRCSVLGTHYHHSVSIILLKLH
jgi:hypothetical protein